MRMQKSGYLTVYAALSLAVLMSLFLAILESTRYHTMELEAKLVMDIAGDSILAEYHREMLEQYGMFWIDTSYGTNQPAVEKVEEHLEYYAEKNLAVDEVFLGDYLYKDFLAMEVGSIDIDKVSVASDGDGEVFRRRAVEVVEADIGISLLEQVAGWLEVVEINGLDGADTEGEMEQVDEQIEAYDGTQKQIGEEWITIEVENPTKKLESLKRKGILQLVAPDNKEISTAAVDTRNLISSRRKESSNSTEGVKSGMNQGNWEEQDTQNTLGELTDRLLWQEYLLRYCGYFGDEKEDGLLQYQLEYLIAGKDNDTENLKSVVHRICAIREAANMLYLLSDQVKCGEAEAVATLIATALTIPELEPVFRAAILLGWAYVESLCDVKHLLGGETVPLLKAEGDWYTDLDCVLEGMDELPESSTGSGAQDAGGLSEGGGGSGAQGSGGLSYADYLRLLLALSNLETQTFRMMDIVEMDIRQTPGNEAFRLDGCIDKIAIQAVVDSKYGYQLTIDTVKQY